jgi:hypothetical protein
MPGTLQYESERLSEDDLVDEVQQARRGSMGNDAGRHRVHGGHGPDEFDAEGDATPQA